MHTLTHTLTLTYKCTLTYHHTCIHPHTCTPSHIPSHSYTNVHSHILPHVHTHPHTCTLSQTPRVLYAIVLFDPLAADFNIDGVSLVMYNGQQRPLSGQVALQAVGTQINQKISPPDRVHVKVHVLHLHVYCISSIRCCRYYFFRCTFLCDYYSRAVFISFKSLQHQ